MDEFAYKNGEMHVENVPLSSIVKDIGSPVYIYSTREMVNAYKSFSEAFNEHNAKICFAVKSNSNLAVINTFSKLGAGADVVSAGELERALTAGISAKNIVYSGVGKTNKEINAGLKAGIYQFNVESLVELRALSDIAVSRNVNAEVGIRINPDVDAETHQKISTGRKQDKFGINIDQASEAFAMASSLPVINPISIAVHIGSQLTDVAPFNDAFTHVANLTRKLRSEGIPISRLDLGGGLGVSYVGEKTPTPIDYASVVNSTLGDLSCELIFEPGRYLTAKAGILLTRIIYIKDNGLKRFVIIDAAMNDLLRPALYNAPHTIQQVTEPEESSELKNYDIVGPVCETGDTFLTDQPFSNLKSDELLAIRDTGAYGAVMSSTYNSRPLVPEVLVNHEDYALIRPRETLKEQLKRDRLAPWQ